MELQFELIKLLVRTQYGKSFYNRFATDTRPAVMKALAPYTGDIKLPPFYDLSHWKVVNNWSGISPHPILMGTKATQGTAYRDPTFIEYFEKFKTIVNCRRLAYHFFEKTMNPVTQAEWFINYIQPYITNDDVLCLDFEQGGETASQLWAFLNRVHQLRPNNLVVIYSRKNLADPIVMTASEKEFFKDFPFWTAGYPTNSGGITTTPPGYIPDQSKWGPVWAWQYTDSGHVAGIDGDTDCNLVEPVFIEWLGELPPPTEEDVVTFPYYGVQRITGRRFGSDVYVTILNTTQVVFEVVHEEPFENGLFKPSSASQKKFSQFAWNGDEWDKSRPLPAYPKNAAYSNGRVYVQRSSAEPSLNIRSDGSPEIIHNNTGREHNTSTGRRYLVENGVMKSYLNGTEPQYTERHPRGLTGVTTTGKVIMVTVDGRTHRSTGITLKEGAQILLEFGAFTAYDRGGGGDAVDVMEGIVQNVPCDTDTTGNPGVERAVPQAILVYAQKENSMTYQYTAKALSDGTRIRLDHNTAANYVNSYPSGTIFDGDELFVADRQLTNSSGVVYQVPGDKWLKVLKVNGQDPRGSNGAILTSPVWVAILHMGNQQICSIVDNGTLPEPPQGNPPQEVVITDDNGVKWRSVTFVKEE